MPRGAEEMTMTDEIPRRKFGGRQPGSGRPVGQNDRPSTVSLPPEILRLIDAARGTENRSAYVVRLIREALADRQSAR